MEWCLSIVNDMIGPLLGFNSFLCYRDVVEDFSYNSSYLNNYSFQQDINLSQMQSKIAELQVQRYSCGRIEILNNAVFGVQNVSQILTENPKKEDIVYKIDKILFPENPIRDYIAEEVRKTKEKYEKRIKMLNELVG